MTKYEITEFDFNDVFSREEHEFKSYDEAVKYIESLVIEGHKHEFEWVGSDPDSYVCYYPTESDDDELRVLLGWTLQDLDELDDYFKQQEKEYLENRNDLD